MTPIISIIMGSTSDLPVMEKACKWLNDNEIPFEVNALSAHRTPEAVVSEAEIERVLKMLQNMDLPALVHARCKNVCCCRWNECAKKARKTPVF